jgi:sulfide:quinone oxidoreductase
VLPTFRQGKALIGVCGAPYKCPPAPSECALMLHDYLVNRGVREACEISFVLPLPSPVPPSPETSRALEAAFKERNINFIPGRRVASVDSARKIAVLDDGAGCLRCSSAFRYRVPKVVLGNNMTKNGWIAVALDIGTKYRASMRSAMGRHGRAKAGSSPKAPRRRCEAG